MSEDHFSYGRYPDPAAWLTGELRDELKKITADRDRLAGEVERLKEERDAARDDEELMSKAKQLCEAERDRLAGEVARLKEERDAAITDRFDAAAERIKAVTAERDRLKAALRLIAVVDQGCGGNLTPMEMAQSAMRQARNALGGDAS